MNSYTNAAVPGRWFYRLDAVDDTACVPPPITGATTVIMSRCTVSVWPANQPWSALLPFCRQRFIALNRPTSYTLLSFKLQTPHPELREQRHRIAMSTPSRPLFCQVKYTCVGSTKCYTRSVRPSVCLSRSCVQFTRNRKTVETPLQIYWRRNACIIVHWLQTLTVLLTKWQSGANLESTCCN